MPGGAPMPGAKKKRPCKYGPRVDGRCPKAPRATTQRASSAGTSPPKAKRPCKYGPRGPDGYCPKKPSARAAAAAATPKGILDRPIPQGTTASGRKRAPTTIRKEATRVAETAVTATVNEAAKRTYQAYRADPERFKGQARELIAALGRAAVPVAIIIGAIKTGLTFGRQAKAQQDAEVEKLSFLALAAAKDKMLSTGQWRPEFSKTLLDQYRQFFRQQLVRINQAGGK